MVVSEIPHTQLRGALLGDFYICHENGNNRIPLIKSHIFTRTLGGVIKPINLASLIVLLALIAKFSFEIFSVSVPYWEITTTRSLNTFTSTEMTVSGVHMSTFIY